jgi:hypothetical protein
VSERDDIPVLASGHADGSPPPAACPECPLADAIERKEREARAAAWAGLLVAVLGVMSWSTWGFLLGGVGALALGVYARRFAPSQAWGAISAGAMALGVLGLRLSGLL